MDTPNLTPKEEKAFQDWLDKKEGKPTESHLILFDDEVNSFQHVIQCLVLYCKHDVIQAEQCATIVHYSGKCEIKSGNRESLIGLMEILSRNKLSVKIE